MELVQFKIIIMMFPLFFVAFLLIPTSIQAEDVVYCDKGVTYAVAVKNINISPDPIRRSTPTTFQLSASTEQPISGGKLVIDVAYFGTHIHQETHDICKETSCPVATGNFVIAHTQSLPFFTPPGSYNLQMSLIDESGKQLTCIGFDFSLGFFGSESAVDI